MPVVPQVTDNCTHLFMGSLSCDVSKWFNSGTEEKYTATLLEQPFAPDNCTFGLALDGEGFVYLAGTTGFNPTDKAIIEKFDFDLLSGSLWKDLSTLSFTWPDPFDSNINKTVSIKPKGCFGAIPLVFDSEDNLWILSCPTEPTGAYGPLTLFKLDHSGGLIAHYTILYDQGDPAAYIVTNPNNNLSMDITSTGLLVLDIESGSVLWTFDTRTNRQADDIILQPTTYVHNLGDIAIVPTNNNIYVVELFIPGDDTFFNNIHIMRYTLAGTFVRKYDLPTIPSAFRRVISRSPDNLKIWANSTVNSFPGDMPPFVYLVDIETGVITKGGNLSTNFGDESIFNMAVCRKNFRHPAQVTLIGAT